MVSLWMPACRARSVKGPGLSRYGRAALLPLGEPGGEEGQTVFRCRIFMHFAVPRIWQGSGSSYEWAFSSADSPARSGGSQHVGRMGGRGRSRWASCRGYVLYSEIIAPMFGGVNTGFGARPKRFDRLTANGSPPSPSLPLDTGFRRYDGRGPV